MSQVLKIFTLRDRKAQIYGPPLLKRSHAEVTRELTLAVNQPSESMLNKFPEDFELCELGTYDQGTAKIELLDAPHAILICDSLKNDPKQ